MTTKRYMALPSLRSLKVLWFRRFVKQVDHEEVIEDVRTDGQLTSRYIFMVLMSCAIATLGLLLSSPSVIIGAMLISPLVSPIISFGFSLCVLDIQQMKDALKGIITGGVLAIFSSWLITTLSPIVDITPEIIARTQPNFFDLLVAILTGIVGGYLIIKRRGQDVIGVAFAAALMTPLAVVGFGLAIGQHSITKGALTLFMTNLLAIALSVSIIATFYGFNGSLTKKRTFLQMIVILIVFGTLSIPLGITLKNVTYKTYVTNVVQNAIEEYFATEKIRIPILNIKCNSNNTTIDVVVLTPKHKPKAQPDLVTILKEKIDRNMTLSLDQILVAQEN
ncbi:MAG: DUF389 domain-containing protein [Rickettsiales bacterium]|nr:DUF389 domain-containing protein [Rickettsiales bacterium]